MNRYLFYRFLNKHSFLRFLAIGFRHSSDKKFLDEILGRTKNSFIIRSNGNKNYGKIIYNVKIDDKMSGFFALNRFVLDALYCADMMGFSAYISVVNTQYNRTNEENDNMFEYYYEQPDGLSLKDVQESFAVAEYKGEHRGWLEDCFRDEAKSLLAGYDFDMGLITKLADISKRKLKLKNNIQEKLTFDINALKVSNKTVGLHYRGNAFKVGFYGHPVCLEIEDYYPFIDECLKNGFENIFIATDDNNALKKINTHYPNRVIYYNDTTRSDDGVDVHYRKDRSNETGYILGYEVLRDMHTLANCGGFICGKSQVSLAAFVEKKVRGEEFNFYKIIDHGLYTKELKGNVRKYMKDNKIATK